jgi:peptidoglycan hydrolase-like protein with peptidoglycan-binding domain
MRVPAAILAAIVVSSTVLAQGDPRANPRPVPESAATPEAKKDTAADAKPAQEAKPKPRPKATHEARPAKNAKTATNGSASAAAPPLKPSGLQDVYAAIPRGDRAAIQNDLTWGGDYSGPIDGEFSERLVAAVKAYQTRHKNPVTGVMSAEERTALATAVAPRKQAVGWRLAEDAVTGARVGLPGKFATKMLALPNGTRWSSEQGQLQIETFRIDTGATLDAVFDQQKKMPRRRIEKSDMQADSFTISGMQGLKKLQVRGFAKNGEVRGITILYDQAMEGTADPLVAPMSGAFVAFPSAFTVAGGEAPRRKVEYGSAVFISTTGHALTDRNLLEGCNVIVLPGIGNAERVLTDPNNEFAVIRVFGARNTMPVGMIGGASTITGQTVTLLGVADPRSQGGGAEVSAVRAKLSAEASTRPLETVPALGFAGAAVLNEQGNFAGIAVLKAPVVAGPAGAPQAGVVPIDRIRNFLEANYIAPASGKPGVENIKASVTRVICVRK